MAPLPVRPRAPLLLPALTLALALALPLQAQRTADAVDRALSHATALEGQVETMALELWEHSEIGLEEIESARTLIQVLREEGFSIQEGVAGMPTAFVASWGSGSPVIGILAEFDALPGIGNAAVPRREPREDGHPHGHGCGHNLFGAASVGAAMAVKRTLDEMGIQGTVKLFGTPAEETLVGKVYMAREGIFDDLDAALDWHPYLTTGVSNNKGLAMNNFQIEFRGQAAHGAADPWNGRSALDAVELMNHGVNLMREHVKPTARIHYVIPDGGEAPNVVPDYARVWYYVRDTVRASVDEYYEWILDVAEGSALATRTEHQVTLITGVHEMNLNRPMQEALQQNLERVGDPGFTAEDHAFARELQDFLGIEAVGLTGEVKPLKDQPEPPGGGSTDVAEVSWITPTAGISVATAAAGVPWHSWATAASHATPGAVRGAWVAAKVLAMTGAQLFTDPALLEAARAHFLEKTGGEAYVSPLPPGQTPPLPDAVRNR